MEFKEAERKKEIRTGQESLSFLVLVIVSVGHGKYPVIDICSVNTTYKRSIIDPIRVVIRNLYP